MLEKRFSRCKNDHLAITKRRTHKIQYFGCGFGTCISSQLAFMYPYMMCQILSSCTLQNTGFVGNDMLSVIFGANLHEAVRSGSTDHLIGLASWRAQRFWFQWKLEKTTFRFFSDPIFLFSSNVLTITLSSSYLRVHAHCGVSPDNERERDSCHGVCRGRHARAGPSHTHRTTSGVYTLIYSPWDIV